MAGAVAIALLTSSKAFVEFSTSGLENALAALVLAGFLAVSSKDRRDAPGVLALSLLAAGCVLNRMDAALLIAPSLAAAILSGSTRRALPLFALGFVPFVAWSAFSTYYYGFPFPNTAYAKLGTGLPVSQLVPQGFRYALNSLAWDPITLITTAAGCAAGLASKRKRLAAVSVGILLHVAYVAWIGGDFMSGRLFTPSLVAGVALIASRVSFSPVAGAAAIGAALLLGFSSERSPLRQPTPNLSANAQRKEIKGKNDGISDERAFYHERTGLIWALRGRVVPSGIGAQKGLQDRERAKRQAGFVRERGAIGMYGYFAGPNVHVLDVTGLADPLLARIPLDSDRPWRIGHFIREVPAGYIESVVSDENHVADPNLAEYYDRLRRVTRGPLDDRGRWGEIWRMNVGRYDGLIAAYVARRAPLDIPERLSENPRLSEEPDDDKSPEGPDR
jgi:arabinofuranosyltransferase